MQVSKYQRTVLRPVFCCLTAVFFASCGATAGSADTAAEVDDVGVDAGKDAKDVAPDVPNADVPSDVAGDTGTDAVAADAVDAKDGDAGTGIDPNLCTTKAVGYQPGDCGSPCTSNKSCSFPFCITTPDNSVCTKDCGGNDPACPAGWKCKQLADNPDPAFGCVPASPNLGKPCQSDNDCRTEIGLATGGGGDYCVSFGDAGAFCGGGCDQGETCPTNFTCQQVKTLTGKLVQQCVTEKTKVDLNCTKRYEAEGDETICAITVGKDHCSGKRHCDSGALTVCDAQTPAPETCNNIDDNCNGLTDEPVPGATCFVTSSDGSLKCPGKPICAGGIESCLGEIPKVEACNGVDDDCNGKTDEGCDDDQDGYCDADMGYDPATKACSKGTGDCDDQKVAIHPKATEVCDGVDNDCNGFADAQDAGLPLSDAHYCENQLGVCSGVVKPISLCSGGAWQACGVTEYKKADPAYGSVEICDDKDNNCNGVIDEGCDDDKDGYCDSNVATFGYPLTCVKGGGDCNDTLAKVHPGAIEACDDIDENCNGVLDEGCDKDKDGWCDANLVTTGAPTVCPNGGGDCDDNSSAIRPDAKELCNAVDDDCNGETDEFWPDLGLICAGGQGQCAVKNGTKICKPDGSGMTCSIQPGPPQDEICDNLDNNCNGFIDEGCDDDGDSYCDAGMGAVGHPLACLAGPGDCNDTDAGIHPGAKEVCDNIDNDCDAKTDSDDGDLTYDDPQFCETTLGVCAGARKPPTLCLGGLWAKCNANQYSGWNQFYNSQESCDDMDNDCNGVTDEGCDTDGDKFCNKAMKVVGAPKVCTVYDSQGNPITQPGDCDDSNAANFPGNAELCDDQDNNCNNQTDEQCDKDQDGYCDAARITIKTPKVCPLGGKDCNDNDKLVNPAAVDVCFDAVDNNCDGVTDANCKWYFSNVTDVQGPDYTGEGFYQCAGFNDLPNSEDVQPIAGWGSYCAGDQWKRVRIVCGQKPAGALPGATWPLLRSIDLTSNVFQPNALPSGIKYGAIGATHGFPADLAKEILTMNQLIVFTAPSDTNAYALDHSYSWVGEQTGFNETFPTLIINHPNSPWDVANCFGLSLWDNISTPTAFNARALLVYVGR